MKELLKEFEMIRVDFANSVQGADFLRLLGEYALDPMGGGEALDKNTLSNLIERAQNEAGFGAFLAYVGGEAVGLLNFNRTFSTFGCGSFTTRLNQATDRSLCDREGALSKSSGTFPFA